MTMDERIGLFIKGWRRRSLLLLDAAGCPPWLAQWRCRPTRKERAQYRELARWLKAEERARGQSDEDEEED